MIIDQLPEMSSVQGTDEIPIERGQTTYKIKVNGLEKVSKGGDTMTGTLLVGRNTNNGAGVNIRSESIADGTVVSAQNWGTTLQFSDSTPRSIGIVHPVFRTDGKQGLSLRSIRAISGSDIYNSLELGTDSSGNAYVVLNNPAAWLEALGLSTITEQRLNGANFRAVRMGNIVQFTCLVGTWSSDSSGILSVTIDNVTTTPRLDANMRPAVNITMLDANVKARLNIQTDGYFSVPTTAPLTNAALRFTACWLTTNPV